MAFSIVSFNGTAVNDGTVFRAYDLVGDATLQRTVRTRLQERIGRWPRFQRSDEQATRISFYVSIQAEALTGGWTLQERLDQLGGIFTPGTTGYLVADFAGSRRKVTGIVDTFLPREGSANRVLVALRVPDGRWRSEDAALFSNGGISLSGDNVLVDSARPVTGTTTVTDGDGIDALAEGSTGIWPAATNLADDLAQTSPTVINSRVSPQVGAAANNLSIITAEKFGSYGLRAQHSAGGSSNLAFFEPGGAGVGYTFLAGKSYVISAWVKLGSSWTGGDVRFQQYNLGGNISNQEHRDADDAYLGEWQYVEARWDQDATDTGGMRLTYLGSPSGAAQNVDIEGIMLQEYDSLAEAIACPYQQPPAVQTAGKIETPAADWGTTQGWFAARIRNGVASGWTTEITEHRHLFGWYGDADNWIRCYYEADADQVVLERRDSGTTESHAATLNWSRTTVGLDEATVVAYWTASALGLAINGGAISTTASTNGPSISAPSVELGSDGNGGGQLCGDIIWALAGTGAITQDDADAIFSQGSGDAGVNLAQWTEELDNAVWVKGSNVSLTADNGQDKDGYMRAERVQFLDGTTSQNWIYQDVVVDSGVGTFTLSAYNYCTSSAISAGAKFALRIEDKDNTSDATMTTFTWGSAHGRQEITHTFLSGFGGNARIWILRIDGATNPSDGWSTMWQFEKAASASTYGRVTTTGNALPTTLAASTVQVLGWGGTGYAEIETGFAVTNLGNLPDDEPSITIQPTQAKTAGNGFTYARDVVFANRVPRAWSNYAFDLTNGSGLDTAALVSGGKAQSDGDDFRVFVDGLEVDRWFGPTTYPFNNAATRVWVNLDLSPGRVTELREAATDSDTTLEVPLGATAPFPESGTLLIDGVEAVDYTGKTASSFTGCTRARRGTSATAHSAADEVLWVEHRIQYVYGNSGASAPVQDDDRKPMIDLDDSTNTALIWNDLFVTDGTPRSMQWQRTIVQDDALQDRLVVEDGAQGVFTFKVDGPDDDDQVVANALVHPFPGGTTSSPSLCDLEATLDGGVGLRLFGIDEFGTRGKVHDFAQSGLETDYTVTVAGTQASNVRLEFVADNMLVAGIPSTSGNATSVELQVGDGNVIRQPITVPASADIASSKVLGVAVDLAFDYNVTFDRRIKVSLQYYDEEAEAYVTIADRARDFDETTDPAGSGTMPDGTFKRYYFYYSTPQHVTPGTQLSIRVENVDTFDVGACDVFLRTYVVPYEGETTTYAIWLMSHDYDHNGEAELPDDESVTIDDLTVRVSSSRTPRVALGSENASGTAYQIQATLTNTTTGQSATIDAVVDLNDELLIDVANRLVRNVTKGLALAHAVEFSDDEAWLTMAAGENVWSYSDTGADGVLVSIGYDHVWQ